MGKKGKACTAAGTAAQAESIAGLSDKLDRYAVGKQRSRLMCAYLRSKYNSRLDDDLLPLIRDLHSCASWLRFHHYYRLDVLKLVEAYTCKRHLLCPFCAARRAAKTVKAYLERLAVVAAERPDLKPVHLVLTVKNGPDLLERFLHLQSSWKRLMSRRRDMKRAKRGCTQLAKAAGGFYSYEVTHSKAGWHPHLHAVLLLDDWIDRTALVDEWRAITGDSQVLWIERIGKGLGDLSIAGKLNAALGNAFAEVAKYAIKFSDLSVADTFTAWCNLKRRRLQGSFGVLRGVKVPESLLDDPLSDEPYFDLIYRYVAGAYSLQTLKSVSRETINGED